MARWGSWTGSSTSGVSRANLDCDPRIFVRRVCTLVSARKRPERLPKSTKRARLALAEGCSNGVGQDVMSDDLIDPEILWAKSTALRERGKTAKDQLLARQMLRLADDITNLAVELRLAAVVAEIKG